MSAPKEAAAILDQWLQLTREEASAIESSKWDRLRKITSRKTALRPSLERAARVCREQGVSLDTFKIRLGRINSLLTRNGEVLARRLRESRDQRESLRQNQATLLRVQRAYARPAATFRRSFS